MASATWFSGITQPDTETKIPKEVCHQSKTGQTCYLSLLQQSKLLRLKKKLEK